LIERLIERDDTAVADQRGEIGSMAGAITINDEPRIGLQRKRRVELLGYQAGHRAGSDIPRDVPVHIVGGRRPGIEASRQSPPPVLAAHDDLTNALSQLDDEWLWVIGRQPKAGGVLHEITCSKIPESMED
jgi:hypothetical protein